MVTKNTVVINFFDIILLYVFQTAGYAIWKLSKDDIGHRKQNKNITFELYFYFVLLRAM